MSFEYWLKRNSGKYSDSIFRQGKFIICDKLGQETFYYLYHGREEAEEALRNLNDERFEIVKYRVPQISLEYLRFMQSTPVKKRRRKIAKRKIYPVRKLSDSAAFYKSFECWL